MLLSATFWVDGHRRDSVPLPDRGLEFGDGLFETLLYAQGRLFYPEYHFRRLGHGLAALGFPDVLDLAKTHLASALADLTQMDVPQVAVRLTVTRGSAPRGYAPPGDCRPRVVIAVSPLEHSWSQLGNPVRLGVASIRLATQPALAGIKHLNRLEQVLAADEKTAAGFDEMLMLGQDNRPVSVISGNVFAVLQGKILTPKLQSCGVRGTRRQLLIDSWAPRLGLATEEIEISRSLLAEADELFYSNSLLGLCPIGSLDDRQWPSNPVCEALHDIYRSENT